MKNWARRLTDAVPALALFAAAALPSATPDPGAVLFLVDQSASMGADPRALARAQRWLLEAECARGAPGQRAGVAVFGQGVELLLAPADAASIDFDALERALAQPRPQLATDTRLDARAEALVTHLARDFHVQEVRVVGDGELGAPAQLAARGPRWTWVELRGPAPDDAAVELAALPGVVAPEATLVARVRYARRGVLAERALAIEVLQDGARVARRELAADAPAQGEIALELRAPRSGTTRLEARCVGANDVWPSNDRSAQVLAVDGAPRVVLVGEIPRLEGGAAFSLQRCAPQELAAALARCEVVWIEERDAGELPAAALARFVEEGGGLVVSGLERHLESGGFDREPWSALLPVDAELEGGIEEVAVLLDASGSMDGARFEEALLGLDALRERWGEAMRVRASCFATELLGWRELKARGATEASSAAQVFAEVEPRGATHLSRAVQVALEGPREVKRAVLVLTDGREEDPSVADPLAAARALAARAESAGVRLHALAIGAEAELPWLEALVGGGRLGSARRVDGAEAIAASLRAAASADRVVRATTKAIAGELPEGFPRELAPVEAHRRARLRAGAAAPFLMAEGQPLVALRAAGAGRVAWVGTSLAALRSTSEAEQLAAAIARWCAGDALSARLEILAADRGEARVRWRADRTGSAEDGRGAVRATWSHPSGRKRSLELLRSGPQSYEASLAASEGGAIALEGGPSRSLPEPSAEELSPFAPRWAFRGRAGTSEVAARPTTPAPLGLGLALALGSLVFVAYGWGRGSSRGRA